MRREGKSSKTYVYRQESLELGRSSHTDCVGHAEVSLVSVSVS